MNYSILGICIIIRQTGRMLYRKTSARLVVTRCLSIVIVDRQLSISRYHISVAAINPTVSLIQFVK